MSYSVEALVTAAEMAAGLARECLASADEFDEAWHRYCEAEARRHQERADWYLERAGLVEATINDAA